MFLVPGASLGLGRPMTEVVLKQGNIYVATYCKCQADGLPQSIHRINSWCFDRMSLGRRMRFPQLMPRPKRCLDELTLYTILDAGYAVVGEVEVVPLAEARALFDVSASYPRMFRPWLIGYALDQCLGLTRSAVTFFRDSNKPMGGRLWKTPMYKRARRSEWNNTSARVVFITDKHESGLLFRKARSL